MKQAEEYRKKERERERERVHLRGTPKEREAGMKGEKGKAREASPKIIVSLRYLHRWEDSRGRSWMRISSTPPGFGFEREKTRA